MGDRIVHGGQYDSEGRLVDRDVATAPLDAKGSKRFGRRHRRRGRHTWLGFVIVIGLASWGLWALATSLQNTTARGWGYVQTGESRSTLLTQLGYPCKAGAARGADSQIIDRGAQYYVWPAGSEWHLVIVGRSSPSTPNSGYVVIDRFVAKRTTSGTDYCKTGVTSDPFGGNPWFLAL